jgi:ADP-ribose pyrophosphatase YjhB (NUDIX family)
MPVKRAASGKQSAGLLLYRLTSGDPEVLLGHPGGPFCRKKDLASWSIPKDLIAEGEPPLVAAKREFNEETGYSPRGETLPLGEARQPAGKTVHVWAVERLGSGRPPEQYVRDGVAAKIRTAVIVSRARGSAEEHMRLTHRWVHHPPLGKGTLFLSEGWNVDFHLLEE